MDVPTIRSYIESGYPDTANNPSVRQIRSELLNEASSGLADAQDRAEAAADPQPGGAFISQPAAVAFPLPPSDFQTAVQNFGQSLAAYDAASSRAQNAQNRTSVFNVEA